MRIEEIHSKKIIYACLNWGYGHVARSLGIVNQLIHQNNSIVFAGNNEQINIFKTYFPSIEFCSLEDYPFQFSGDGKFAKDLWNSKKGLKKAISKEQAWLASYMEENQIDVVISDHRYGFFSNKLPSVFITHQLNLPVKKWQFIGQLIHKKLMKRFSEIWVIDYPDSRLAGQLSKTIGMNEKYIGPYSRFMFQSQNLEKDISSVLIVNGPKAYSKKLVDSFSTYKLVITSQDVIDQFNLLNGVNNADWIKCDELIKRAKIIYSYCGYSTLLDREFIKTDFVLIPTKGQPEQEYLTQFHQLLD